MPNFCKENVLREIHSNREGGHFGVNWTLGRVRHRFHCINYRKGAEEWCKQCDSYSSKKSPRTRSKRAMMQYISGSLWEGVAVDMAGPFSRTESDNKYLMIAKYFSAKSESNHDSRGADNHCNCKPRSSFGDSH